MTNGMKIKQIVELLSPLMTGVENCSGKFQPSNIENAPFAL